MTLARSQKFASMIGVTCPRICSYSTTSGGLVHRQDFGCVALKSGGLSSNIISLCLNMPLSAFASCCLAVGTVSQELPLSSVAVTLFWTSRTAQLHRQQTSSQLHLLERLCHGAFA